MVLYTIVPTITTGDVATAARSERSPGVVRKARVLGATPSFVLRGGQEVNRYRPKIDRVLMTLRANAMWTGADSNVVDRLGQSIFEYNRALVGVSVGFSFN